MKCVKINETFSGSTQNDVKMDIFRNLWLQGSRLWPRPVQCEMWNEFLYLLSRCGVNIRTIVSLNFFSEVKNMGTSRVFQPISEEVERNFFSMIKFDLGFEIGWHL